MSSQNINKPLELAEHTNPAVLTPILIAILMLVSFQYHPTHGELWLHDHIFQANKMLDLINQRQYIQILQILFYSNFLTINLWQLILSVYFLFTFGLGVESRLGPARFTILILLSATIPWVVQYWDILNNSVWPLYFERLKSDTYFFGPSYILCALATAQMLLIPRRSSHELYIMQSGQSGKSELFNRKKAKPISEYFGLPSELFISAFFIYLIVERAFVILPWKDLDTIDLYAAISTILVAWIFNALILRGLKSRFQDHPLKIAAVKQYNELIILDVDSESAVKGTARALGLPDEQVRSWIIENKGKLHTK